MLSKNRNLHHISHPLLQVRSISARNPPPRAHLTRRDALKTPREHAAVTPDHQSRVAESDSASLPREPFMLQRGAIPSGSVPATSSRGASSAKRHPLAPERPGSARKRAMDGPPAHRSRSDLCGASSVRIASGLSASNSPTEGRCLIEKRAMNGPPDTSTAWRSMCRKAITDHVRDCRIKLAQDERCLIRDSRAGR